MSWRGALGGVGKASMSGGDDDEGVGEARGGGGRSLAHELRAGSLVALVSDEAASRGGGEVYVCGKGAGGGWELATEPLAGGVGEGGRDGAGGLSPPRGDFGGGGAAASAVERLMGGGGGLFPERCLMMVVKHPGQADTLGLRGVAAEGRLLRAEKQAGRVPTFHGYKLDKWETWRLEGASLGSCVLRSAHWTDRPGLKVHVCEIVNETRTANAAKLRWRSALEEEKAEKGAISKEKEEVRGKLIALTVEAAKYREEANRLEAVVRVRDARVAELEARVRHLQEEGDRKAQEANATWARRYGALEAKLAVVDDARRRAATDAESLAHMREMERAGLKEEVATVLALAEEAAALAAGEDPDGTDGGGLGEPLLTEEALLEGLRRSRSGAAVSLADVRRLLRDSWEEAEAIVHGLEQRVASPKPPSPSTPRSPATPRTPRSAQRTSPHR